MMNGNKHDSCRWNVICLSYNVRAILRISTADAEQMSSHLQFVVFDSIVCMMSVAPQFEGLWNSKNYSWMYQTCFQKDSYVCPISYISTCSEKKNSLRKTNEDCWYFLRQNCTVVSGWLPITVNKTKMTSRSSWTEITGELFSSQGRQMNRQVNRLGNSSSYLMRWKF